MEAIQLALRRGTEASGSTIGKASEPGLRIRIRIRVKSWIRIRRSSKAQREHWRAVNAYSGGLEAHNGALWDADSHHFDEERDPVS
jgi:hypothetical protein